MRRLLEHPQEDPGPLEPELERLVRLLVRNGRLEDVRFVFRSFIGMYYRSRGIEVARLTTVVPAEGLERKLRSVLEKQLGCEVLLETHIDPDLLGGFTLEIGDYLLDGSVRSQIEAIRRQFVISNNRIV